MTSTAASNEALNSRFGFTGREISVGSTMQYRARQYDGAYARFLQQDSFKGRAVASPSLQRYVYVHNNPIRYVNFTPLSDAMVALFEFILSIVSLVLSLIAAYIAFTAATAAGVAVVAFVGAIAFSIYALAVAWVAGDVWSVILGVLSLGFAIAVFFAPEEIALFGLVLADPPVAFALLAYFFAIISLIITIRAIDNAAQEAIGAMKN